MFSHETLRPFLFEARSLPGVREAVVLSTCHRFEAYLVSDDPETSLAALRAHLSQRRGVAETELEAHGKVRTGADAVRHLFRVAASLDSMVIGEPQILGQVHQAHQAALAEHATGAVTNTLFNRASAAGKKARAETGISRHPVSIPAVAVRFAERTVGDLAGRTVLLLGAGKMGSLAAETLVSRGLGRVLVSSRTGDTTEAFAKRIGATAVAWIELSRILPEVDILLCATDAPHYVLSASDVKAARASAGIRPLLAVDISMPRNLDPELAKLPGVSLYGIEDLAAEVGRNRAERSSEASAAEALIAAEVERFLPALAARGVSLGAAASR